MTLVRYEPWNLLQGFHKDLNKLFEENRDEDNSRVVTSGWAPAVDIKEEENRFVLHADLPGIEPNEIEITMDEGVLTIKGERVFDKEEESQGYKRVERARGTFYRRFSLPDTADAENIEAQGKNGVLEIVIPKKVAAQPRRITVK